jgi:hypothetical protein
LYDDDDGDFIHSSFGKPPAIKRMGVSEMAWRQQKFIFQSTKTNVLQFCFEFKFGLKYTFLGVTATAKKLLLWNCFFALTFAEFREAIQRLVEQGQNFSKMASCHLVLVSFLHDGYPRSAYFSVLPFVPLDRELLAQLPHCLRPHS